MHTHIMSIIHYANVQRHTTLRPQSMFASYAALFEHTMKGEMCV